MNKTSQITRRDSLRYFTAATLAGGVCSRPAHARGAGAKAGSITPKPVAAVLTAYRKGLHADVLLGKILEGWKQDGGPGLALRLVSMYVDQFPPGDLARDMSAKYNVPIFDTIAQAVTVGGDRIPVEGVISVGEQGSYPYNKKGQHLYPRRRFFGRLATAHHGGGRGAGRGRGRGTKSLPAN